MSDDNLLSIPVNLAGRTYPVLVTKDEEETIKEISAKLNSEFSDLHARYANKLNKQDILSMLLLTYAHDLHKEKTTKDLAPVEKRVTAIEDILEQAFEHKS